MPKSTFRLLLPALLFLLVTCRSGTSGPQFIGKWQGTADPTNTLQIVNNGDRYMISEHDMKGDHRYIAALNKNTLIIFIGDAPTKQIFYRENTDRLQWGGSEFKRAVP